MPPIQSETERLQRVFAIRRVFCTASEAVDHDKKQEENNNNNKKQETLSDFNFLQHMENIIS